MNFSIKKITKSKITKLWKKIYILMHRIQMKLELSLNQIIILKIMNMKVIKAI